MLQFWPPLVKRSFGHRRFRAVDKSKDYFPLSVEFTDKLYAGGFIKGGKWVKREGAPSDTAILFGRIIDRAIRPLFPAGFKQEVQVMATILSNDKDNDVIIPAFTAVSAALMLSDIPFNGPVSAVRVGLKEGKISLFPTVSELKTSPLDLLVCRDLEGINMIEAGAQIVDNDIVLSAIEEAFKTGEQLNRRLTEFSQKHAKAKIKFEDLSPPKELVTEISKLINPNLEEFMKDGTDGAHIAAEEKSKK